MKKKVCFLIFILGVFFFSSVNAATFTIEIDDTVPILEIQSFQIYLEVSSDFSFSSYEYGNAIPTTGLVGWDKFNSVDIDNEVFKITGGDFDGQFRDDPHDMVPGILATFDYTGMITGLDETALQFSNHGGNNQWPDLSDTSKANFVDYRLTGDRLIFSAVPIPSSLFLLGCGIFAVAGISRRKK